MRAKPHRDDHCTADEIDCGESGGQHGSERGRGEAERGEHGGEPEHEQPGAGQGLAAGRRARGRAIQPTGQAGDEGKYPGSSGHTLGEPNDTTPATLARDISANSSTMLLVETLARMRGG